MQPGMQPRKLHAKWTFVKPFIIARISRRLIHQLCRFLKFTL